MRLVITTKIYNTVNFGPSCDLMKASVASIYSLVAHSAEYKNVSILCRFKSSRIEAVKPTTQLPV